MARTFTFRLTSDGIKELERDLAKLGAEGQRIFDGLKQAAPGLADGLRNAEAQLGRTRGRLTEVAKESTAAGKALSAAGAEAEVFAQGFAGRLGAVGSILGGIGPIGLAAAAGVGALTAAFGKAITMAEEAERAQRKLEAVLRATGESAGLTAKQISGFASQLQSESLFGGAQIKEAAAQLATFRGISGDTFKRVIRDAADLSTVFGGDLSTSVLKLGKALDDPIKGYDDLAKAGVRLTHDQEELIKTWVKAGDLAKAQGLILQELEKRVGGAAAGDQTGLTGAMNRLEDVWGDFWENAGARITQSGAIEAVDSLLKKLQGFSESYNNSLNATSDLFNNLPSDTSIANRAYAGTVGVTRADYIKRLEGQLATAQSDLETAKSVNTGSPEYDAFSVDESQRLVDSLKGQISALKELDRFQRQATKSAEEHAIAAGKQADADAAASAKASALADDIKKQTDARADASKKLDELLEGIQSEREQLHMTAGERKLYTDNLKLEDVLKGNLIDKDDKRIAQYKVESGIVAAVAHDQEDLGKILKEVGDEIDNRRKKEAEMIRGQSALMQDLRQQSEKQSELLIEPFKNTIDGVQESFTDFYDQLYSDGIDTFESLADAAGDVFRHLAAELTSLFTIRPILSGVTSTVSAMTANQQALAGGAGVGVTGANGSGSLTGGFNLSSLLGNGTAAGGQWNTGFGTMLFGSQPVTGPYGSTIGSQVQGLFGSSGGGQFGSFLNSPLGGGATAGVIAGLATYASGGTAAESLGAGIGGAVGGIAGSYFGPVGSMVGSTIGSMLGKMVGGLFGKKDKWKKQKAIAGADLGFDANGLLDVDGTFTQTKGKGVKADGSTSKALGSGVSDAFNDFFLGLGATFDPDADAAVRQVYQAKTKGKKKKGEKNYFYGTFAGENTGTVMSAEELIPSFLSGSLAIAVEKGLVAGISDTLKTIFTTVFKDNGRAGVTSQDELNRMVEFGKFYDRVDQIRTPAQAAAEALKELEKNMRSAKSTAEEFGLAVDHVDEVFKANFIDDLADEILSLKDPEEYALKELEKEKAARIAVAEKLGVDITDVEELYALKRQQIVEQGLSSVGQSFRDFFDSLVYGENSAISPELQLATAKSAYDQAVASGDKSGFQQAAQQYLDLMRDAYASTEAYVAVYQDVLRNTIKLGGLNDPKSAGSLVSGYGRNGDSLVAHLNPSEAALLKALGGSGTINPETGLLEFWSEKGVNDKTGGENGKGGKAAPDKGGRDAGNGGVKGGTSPKGNPAINPGNPNIGLGGPNYSGPQGPGTGVNAANPNNEPGTPRSPRDGGVGGMGWDSSFGPAPTSLGNGTWGSGYGPDVTNTESGVPVDIDKFMHDWADYQGIDYGDVKADTWADTLGNFLGSIFGFNEMNPITDKTYGMPGGTVPGQGAGLGWDPAGLIGSILGGLLGMPFGGGLLADQISKFFDRPLEIALGNTLGGSAPGTETIDADNASLADAASSADALSRNMSLDFGFDNPLPGAGSAGPLADKSLGAAANDDGMGSLEKLAKLQQTTNQTLAAATASGNADVVQAMRAVQAEISALRKESAASMSKLAAATESNNYYLRFNRGNSK